MRLVWESVFAFLFLHLGAIYGQYLLLYEAKTATICYGLIFGYILNAISISVGAHRLYSHRSFKSNKWIRLALMASQTLTGQKSLYVWARDHRLHHRYTDTNADPHNSRRGFFFSHIGWLFVRKHPDVINKGAFINMADMEADPIVMFQKKYYAGFFTFMTGVLTAVPCLFWSESFTNSFFICFVYRIVLVYHGTFTINSFAHIFGMKPFTKDIEPRNNLVAQCATLGDGWHNYHHTFPWDYRSSEFGSGFNLGRTFIEFCARFGWAYDLRKPSQEMIMKHVLAKGDGSHPPYANVEAT